MIIVCKKCDTHFTLDETRLKKTGSKVRCAKCGDIFKVYPFADAQPDESDKPVKTPPIIMQKNQGLRIKTEHDREIKKAQALRINKEEERLVKIRESRVDGDTGLIGFDLSGIEDLFEVKEEPGADIESAGKISEDISFDAESFIVSDFREEKKSLEESETGIVPGISGTVDLSGFDEMIEGEESSVSEGFIDESGRKDSEFFSFDSDISETGEEKLEASLIDLSEMGDISESESQESEVPEKEADYHLSFDLDMEAGGENKAETSVPEETATPDLSEGFERETDDLSFDLNMETGGENKAETSASEETAAPDLSEVPEKEADDLSFDLDMEAGGENKAETSVPEETATPDLSEGFERETDDLSFDLNMETGGENKAETSASEETAAPICPKCLKKKRMTFLLIWIWRQAGRIKQRHLHQKRLPSPICPKYLKKKRTTTFLLIWIWRQAGRIKQRHLCQRRLPMKQMILICHLLMI